MIRRGLVVVLLTCGSLGGGGCPGDDDDDGAAGVSYQSQVTCEDPAEPGLMHQDDLITNSVASCIYHRGERTVDLNLQNGDREDYSMAEVRVAGLTGPGSYDTDGLDENGTSVSVVTSNGTCTGESWVDTSCSAGATYCTIDVTATNLLDLDLAEGERDDGTISLTATCPSLFDGCNADGVAVDMTFATAELTVDADGCTASD